MPHTAIPISGASTGTYDFSQDMQGISEAETNRDPSGFTGAWILLKNDTDNALYLAWRGATNYNYSSLPGEKTWMPVPQNIKMLDWSTLYTNVVPSHPNNMLVFQFFSPNDIAGGHIPIDSGLVNPSLGAAAIGPGVLPPGVTIPIVQATPTNNPATANVTVTTQVTIVSFAVAVDGWYYISGNCQVNAAVAGRVAFLVQYNSALDSAAHTAAFAADSQGGGIVAFDNVNVIPNQVYACYLLPVYALHGTTVFVTYRDQGTAPINDLVRVLVDRRT